MRLQDKEIKRFHTKDLHYLSIWWLNNQGFGAARLAREVTDAWIQKKWSLGGVSFTSEAPELSDKEIESIPRGQGILGPLGYDLLGSAGENQCWDDHQG